MRTRKFIFTFIIALIYSAQINAQLLLPNKKSPRQSLAPLLPLGTKAPVQTTDSPPLPAPELFFSSDCLKWKKQDEESQKLPYLKTPDGLTYVNEKLELVIIWTDNKLVYARKEGDLGAILTSDGYNFKTNPELIGRNNIGNILIAMTEEVSGSWAFDNKGTEMRYFRIPSNRNTYPGLICSQKEKCYLLDKQKKRHDINNDELLNAAKVDYPVNELKESLQNSCRIMQAPQVDAELSKFIKNCKINLSVKKSTASNIKKICAEAANTVKPLLEESLK